MSPGVISDKVFFGKVVLLGATEFHGFEDDLKIKTASKNGVNIELSFRKKIASANISGLARAITIIR